MTRLLPIRSGRHCPLLSWPVLSLSQTACTVAGLAVFTLTASAHAQVDLGELSGSVKDSSGAIVANATVVMTNEATAISRSTTSNAAGIYVFPALPQGAYVVKIDAAGFAAQTLRTSVSTGTTTALDIKLNVGSVAEQVNVAASPALELQADSHEVRTSLTTEALTQLPSSGRNALSLALTAPGVNPGSDPSESTSSAQFFLNTGTEVQVGGGLDVQTGYIVDGVENVNLLTQTANILPSVESIREMDIITNGADARYRQPGIVNITTRSGTKDFHGTAYDFLQNDFFNALPYNFSATAPTPTPLRYNLFGGNFGGPILRKRLFFFVDYEGLRSHTTSSGLYRVPTAAELTGDFSASTTQIYDPATYASNGGTTLSYLTETGKNAIPSSVALDPFAVQFLKAYYPAANIPFNTTLNVNYQAPILATSNSNEYLTRVDYSISSKDQLYGAFGQVDSPNTTPTFVPNLFGRVYEGKGDNVLAEENHVFSSTLVSTARFGYNRSNYFETIQGAGTTNYDTKFGLKNLNPLPSQYAPPYVSLSSNFSNVGYQNAPQGAIQNRYEIAEQINLVLGRHSIFFGGELYKTDFNGTWVISNNGAYSFNGSFTSLYTKGVKSKTATGIPLADFLLGYPSSATGATGVSAGDFKETEVAGFLQDDWKVTPQLTLNLGLRYQFDNPPSDANGHGSIYDWTTNTNIPGTWHTNYADFAPRVGFAYAPTHRTVIRGGAGIYYAGSPYNMLQFLLAHAPNFYTQAPTFQITAPTQTENAFVANPTAAGQRPQTLSTHMPDPNVQEFNLFVEQRLQKHLDFTVGYAGEIGRHESVRGDANQFNSFAPGTTSLLYNQGPYSAYIGSVFAQVNIASSNSNALQSTLKAHLNDGSQFLVSYQYSKQLNNSDGDRYSLGDWYNPHLTYGVAAFDRTNALTASGVYHLPIGPGEPIAAPGGYLGRLALAGWQASFIYQVATGLPVDITATNTLNTGTIQSFYAQKICNPNANFTQSRSKWFNTACFAQPGNLQEGIGGRNGVREPGIDNFNLGLDKNFLLSERQQLQLRAEMFNVPNHPQFSLPGSLSVSSASLGVLTGTSRGMRSMQLALRYTF
jgi:hypothetical protein